MAQNTVPRFTANIGGMEVSQESPQGLEYFMVEDHLDMIGVAEMSFKAGKGGQAPWSSFEQGQDIEITVSGSSRKLFVGTVAGMKHGQTKGTDALTLKAMDPLAKVAASRETKTWEDMADSDVVNEILGKYGVTGTIDTTEGKSPYTFQRNESDFAFLRRLAARNGYLMVANQGKVDFKKPQASGQAATIAKDQLISMDYSQSTKNIPQNVKVIGWDYATKKKIEGSAGAGDIQNIGSGQNTVAAGGQTWGGDAVISDVWVDSQEAAKRMATAEMNRLARMGVQGRATLQGSGDLFAGGLMNMSQHKTGFNPEVMIVSSRHRIHNKTGFVTEVTFCSNTMPK
jgi:phage protein D